jgi:CheY-like chemotaxis protein
MSLTINNKSIERVMVVDNQPDSLDAIAYSIEEASLEPIVYTKPFTSIEDCLSRVTTQAQAAIFAHHLGPQNTVHFNGASAVAHLYQQQFPSLLVTAWAEAEVDNIRAFRQYIPVLIRSGHAQAETIQEGFKLCLSEFEQQYAPNRRSWRTILRIKEVDINQDLPTQSMVYALVPAWNPHEVVRFPLSLIPEHLQPAINTDTYLFAKVNTGAEHYNELYFAEFEVAEKPQGKYAELLLS